MQRIQLTHVDKAYLTAEANVTKINKTTSVLNFEFITKQDVVLSDDVKVSTKYSLNIDQVT